MAELLKLGVGLGLRDVGAGELVSVALQGEFPMSGLDVVGCVAAVKADHFVVAPPLQYSDFVFGIF